MRNAIRTVIPFLIAASTAPLLSSCGEKGGSAHAYGFDTLWDIELYEGKQSDCDAIAEIIMDASSLLDPYNKRSALSKLNADRVIASDSGLADVLSAAISMQESTGGAFNPFMLDLADAWKEALGKKEILDESLISAYLEKIEGTCIRFHSDSIAIEGEGNIDLGAIGKGYCMDLIQDYLSDKGIAAFRISGGRSSLLLGKSGNALSKSYLIIPADYPSVSFEASECGISTSSISEQRYEIDGVTYSHIVNPFTGSAIPQYRVALAKLDFASAHEIPFPNAFLGAASTAFFSMTPAEIKEYCSDNNMGYLLGNDNGIIDNTLGI